MVGEISRSSVLDSKFQKRVTTRKVLLCERHFSPKDIENPSD